VLDTSAWSNFAPYGDVGYSMPVQPTLGSVEVDSAVTDCRLLNSKQADPLGLLLSYSFRRHAHNVFAEGAIAQINAQRQPGAPYSQNGRHGATQRNGEPKTRGLCAQPVR